MPEYYDALKAMYEEHVTHARHHEAERERMTALVVAVATALIGVASHEGLGLRTLPLSLLLIPLGVFGKRFSEKHFERNRLHTTIASKFRDAIDAYLINPTAPVPPNVLDTLRNAGETQHNNSFVPSGKRNISKTPVVNWRLYEFWNRLHVAIIVIGLVLVLSTLSAVVVSLVCVGRTW